MDGRVLRNAAIAVIGAALVLTGVLTNHWWTAHDELGLGEVFVGLRKVEACAMGMCVTAPLELGRQHIPFQITTAMTCFGGIAVAVAIVAGVVIRVINQLPAAAKLAAVAAATMMVLPVSAIATFPGSALSGAHLSWSIALTIAGGFFGMLGCWSLSSEGSGFEGGEYRPISIAGPAPLPAAPPAPSAMAQRADLRKAVTDSAAKDVAATSDEPVRVNRLSSHARPANVDAAPQVLRFVVKELGIAESGLTATGLEGTRTVAWQDLTAFFAAQLPADPPFEKMLFLDLVVASGAPLRLVPATRANYGAMPGGAAATSIENFRKLAAYALAKNPAITSDPQTAAFLKERKPPRVFLGIEQFVQYDARY